MTAALRQPLRTAVLVAAALALYWAMAVSVSPRMGVTGDEVVHLTGGYSYWKFNDYRLHPENGTLAMRLAALPLLGMDLRFPPLTTPAWLNSQVEAVGYEFFYQLGNPLDTMLWRGRAMMALAGVFALWLTWRWARGLFGPAAGWLALLLGVFSPTMLAHGGLITSDMVLTGAMLAAITVFWRLLHRATWGRLLVAGLAAGAVFLSKVSGVLLVPMAALLLVARLTRPAPLVLDFGRMRWVRGRVARAAAGAGLLGTAGLLGVVVLWAGYGFRFSGFNRALSDAHGYYFSWPVILDEVPPPSPWSEENPSVLAPARRLPNQPTAMTHLIGALRDAHALPEAYLFGFAHTYKFSRYRPAFFMGEAGATGWKLFFPTAFLFKTTLSVLLLFATGVVAVLRPARHGARSRRLYRSAPLWLFFGLYWLLALNLHLNIGHRHLLPIYPIVFIFAGATTLWLRTTAARGVFLLLGLAVVAQAADSIRARPFYLSYFQPLTGGTERAYRYFVDSSLDWGQGLPDFTAWLQAKRQRGDASPVYLSYFGADSVKARHLDVRRVADDIADSGARSYPAQFAAGWYVISATQFQRVYLNAAGPWTAAREASYRHVQEQLRQTSANQSAWTDAERARALQAAMDLEILQFARLCHFLRNRPPEQVIGGSLLVFHLTDTEIGAALNAPWEKL